MCVPSFIVIGYCVSELHGHTCPNRNVLPEAVYVCFAKLHCLPNYLHICMIKVRGAITSPSFVTLLLLVTEIAIYIYCLRLFIAVLQELHCLPNCLHVCVIRVGGCYHITKFRCSTPSGF